MRKRYIPMEFRVLRIGERVIGPVMGDCPKKANDYWSAVITKSDWYDRDKEHLVVLLLNTKLCITGHNLIAIGSLNECIAHPREILKPAIVLSAHSFILMHNHPSGDCAPSEADRRITSKIAEGAKFLDIRFIDHVIHGCPEHSFSFRESGLI